MLDHAVIDSFVMSGNNDEMRLLRQLSCQLLIQTTSCRRHQENLRFLACDLRFQILYRCKDRLGFHYHPLSSSERRIVDHVMFVSCPIAQVMDVQIDDSVLLGPLHDALAQRSPADFRKQRDNVDSHRKKTSNVELNANTVAAVCD